MDVERLRLIIGGVLSLAVTLSLVTLTYVQIVDTAATISVLSLILGYYLKDSDRGTPITNADPGRHRDASDEPDRSVTA